MSDHRYLLDTNALSKLSREQRASTFVQENCRVPTEVLHEARWFPDVAELTSIEYKMSAQVFEALREVMATVPKGDTSLVDLYANQGNADPILVACALDGRRDAVQYLFAPTWVIVSDDHAVRAKAAEFDIEVRANSELIELFEANED